MPAIVTIHATPRKPLNELHPLDRQVPEQTVIQINAAVPSRHLANAALDIYHDQIAIRQPEDFDLEAQHNGTPITPCDEETRYQNAGKPI
ncbi:MULTISPECIES: hypothetical protein [Marinobacter]|uniref:Uncharacterized protein n=1 Tax=Marinobacter nauticus (strain ATCC 700491 / DSM 11845 / VT8) TaxID=351348 RepID=A1U848_MARN8|nr:MULTISPECIES: hypothetical protein [Marinobacter]ABM21167.1 hypothetical protein Maqu_4316 [Marinobacter nauticus VT8]|tara:strand:+ start:239 stop:508 length:270 start_codon:yes stop_codon:yes gene_type:complete